MAHVVQKIQDGKVHVSSVKSGSALNARRYWKAECTKRGDRYDELHDGKVVEFYEGSVHTKMRWVDV